MSTNGFFFFFSLHQVKNKGGEKSHPFDKTSVVCIYTAQVAVRIEENNIFFDYIVMSLNNDVTYACGYILCSTGHPSFDSLLFQKRSPGVSSSSW